MDFVVVVKVVSSVAFVSDRDWDIMPGGSKRSLEAVAANEPDSTPPPGKRRIQRRADGAEQDRQRKRQKAEVDKSDTRDWCVRPGAIQSVTLTNFMCHAKFTYTPNSR